MVSANQLIERNNRTTPMFSKAASLTDLVEGGFKEGGVYYFKGKSYALRDLPDYIRNGAGFVIELYLKLKEGRKYDNQR